MFEDGLPNEEPDWLQQGDVVAYLTSSDIQHPWFFAYNKIESAEHIQRGLALWSLPTNT
jgi:hypothetical protein